jgi:RimJ/RimL family protein N-acetyltransferase
MCVIDTSPTIETRRLTLRAPVMSDTERLASLGGERDIARMTTRMPWPYGRRDAEAFISSCQAQDRRRDNTFVIDLENEGVVGVLGLFTPTDALLETGYWIGKPYWGRGLATEALQGALAWTKQSWRRRVVTAGHFADNAASGQVLIKAGFLYTGRVEMKPSLSRGQAVATRMMVWLA